MEMLKAALAHAQQGRRVFPCRPNKTPYTETGFKEATLDELTIRKWWAHWPDAMIGIPTGDNGVFVLDVDVKAGVDGFESLHLLEQQNGKLPETVEVMTPSGGAHKLFIAPAGVEVRNSAGKLGPGLDIRGTGGYTIAPPSETNGRRYEYEGSSDPFDGVAIAHAPEWLIALICEPARPQPEPASDGGFIVEGQRNVYLTRVAGSMRRQGMTEAAMLAALSEQNRAACRPPLPDEEIETIAHSVARYRPEPSAIARAAQPQQVHAPSLSGPPNSQAPSPGAPVPALEPREYPIIWATQAKPKLDQAALVRGLILPGTMVVTYGESNSGKTFHAVDRALCMTLGRKWMDRETEPGFVLYCAAEGAHSVEHRVYAWCKQFAPEVELIPFAILPQSIDLFRPEADTEYLIDFIKRTEDRLGMRCIQTYADTVARVMAAGNENAAEDMGALISNADKIRQDIGCAFEGIHHSGKDSARGARGHSSLKAATDTEIEVINADGYHVVTVTKQRDLPVGDEFAFELDVIELGRDRWGYPVTTCVPRWMLDHQPGYRPNSEAETTLDAREVQALELLRELTAHGSIHLQEWAEAAKKKGILKGRTDEARRKEMQRIARRLLQAGFIQTGMRRGVYMPKAEKPDGPENNSI